MIAGDGVIGVNAVQVHAGDPDYVTGDCIAGACDAAVVSDDVVDVPLAGDHGVVIDGGRDAELGGDSGAGVGAC